MHRYTRQENMVNMDKIRNSEVTIVGLGGVGCPALLYLALAGVGRINIIDKDTIDTTNLNRQFLYTEEDIGKKKTRVAKKRIEEINPHVRVNILEDFTEISGEVVLDCLDNWESRIALWEEALRKKTTVIHGAVGGWKGQVAVIRDSESVAKMKTLKTKREDAIGSVSGIIGSLMATICLKILSEGAPKRDFIIFFKLPEMQRFFL